MEVIKAGAQSGQQIRKSDDVFAQLLEPWIKDRGAIHKEGLIWAKCGVDFSGTI